MAMGKAASSLARLLLAASVLALAAHILVRMFLHVWAVVTAA